MIGIHSCNLCITGTILLAVKTDISCVHDSILDEWYQGYHSSDLTWFDSRVASCPFSFCCWFAVRKVRCPCFVQTVHWTASCNVVEYNTAALSVSALLNSVSITHEYIWMNHHFRCFLFMTVLSFWNWSHSVALWYCALHTVYY